MKSFLSLMLAASLSLATAAIASAQDARGNLRAVRVDGDVQVQPLAGGPSIKLVDGAVIRDRTRITAGADGRAILLFSSGTMMTVRDGTVIEINEFVQEPFENVDLRSSPEEPTVSRTNVTVAQGVSAFRIQKLRTGSEFNIRNPLGAAGVRGTSGGMSVFRDGNTITTKLSLVTGSMVFTPYTQGEEGTNVTANSTLVSVGTLGPDGSVVGYQESVASNEREGITGIEDDINEMNSLFNQAGLASTGSPEDAATEAAPTDAGPTQPPAPTATTQGGPRNPVNFTSPP
jgi:hypothetical protein